MPLEPIRETYDVICDAASKVYEGLSLVFPALPGWVAGRRTECFIRVTQKTQEKLDRAALPKETLRHCSLKLGVPWVENASLEEDETLQELWANLLANALNPNYKANLSPTFTGIIKELSPIDVRVINLLREFVENRKNYFFPRPGDRFIREEFKERLGVDWNELEVSLENLLRLRLIDATETIHVPKTSAFGDVELHYSVQDLERDGLRFNTEKGLAPGSVHFTALGLAFIDACVVDAGDASAETSDRSQNVEKQETADEDQYPRTPS